jgi:MinD superfamily P-loop ATPase
VSINSSQPIQLAGFDIEKPDLINLPDAFRLQTEEVFAAIPRVETVRCKFCGACAVYCQHQAIRFDRYKPSVSIITERCAACGECITACNRNAISPTERLTGYITQGRNENRYLLVGQIDGTESFHIPLINNMLDRLHPEAIIIGDFPPGNSDQVKMALQHFHLACILLKPSLGWERHLGIMRLLTHECDVPSGIILNKIRHEEGFVNEVNTFCSEHEIPLFGVLPFNAGLENHFYYDLSMQQEALGKALSGIVLNINSLAKAPNAVQQSNKH